MTVRQTFESILSTITPQVSFGSATIHIHSPSQLPSGQIGYSVDPKGASLVGDKDGDWRPTWVVIGYSESGGDPLFIDTSENDYPVYTAPVGQGRWDRRLVATSLTAFSHALSAVAAVAQGREHPVALEQNPLTESEKDSVLATIKRENRGIDLEFWDILLVHS